MKKVQTHFIILILLVGFLAFVLLWFQYHKQNQLIKAYADEVMDQRMNLAKSLLHINNNLYRSLTNDYTFWDEMIGFIDKPDYEWAADNIRNIIDTYHGNAISIFTIEGEKIYSVSNPEREDILNYNFMVPAITDRLLREKLIQFYVLTSAGIMDVNAATVHPTADPRRLTPPRGFMFVGKLLDSSFIAQVEASTLCKVAILYQPPGVSLNTGILTRSIPLANPGDPTPVAYIRLSKNLRDIVRFEDFFDTFFYLYVAAIIVGVSVVLFLILIWIVVPL